MSLQGFQQALCELVASPALCVQLRNGTEAVLDKYALSERERRRVVTVVHQRGMSTNCSLYRSNRITPLYTLLHYSCFVLSACLAEEVDLYWQSTEFRDLQFKEEIERFAEFLRRRVASGKIKNELLPEILDFEIATNSLRFAPRRWLQSELAAGTVAFLPSLHRLHPLMRVVRFDHDPSTLLRLLAERKPPPYTLIRGEFYLLLNHVDRTLTAAELDRETGRVLLGIQNGMIDLDEVRLAPLVEAGLVIDGQ